ncbi:ATP-dependent DNA helicase [Phaeovulum vinaykumarii]|uniref:Exodeoxyribonuclease-5 n=1 Tax=Phaeovulum vinaykumarii TaxID=407234 RepID=A0A1N7K2N2_9RHOB|nr:AAA family ATPase [Phaeovulum vinaykumarii]SIS55807.1 exodeoxyribonuclease-5 [Phaeovulum vinaykumarii]SOB92565.1 exodeoxyribonuclease-5 [Phaeovulum vinaykumarii]
MTDSTPTEAPSDGPTDDPTVAPAPALQFSPDQAEAWDRVAGALEAAGIDILDGTLLPEGGTARVLAITGKAGSGKTMLLAQLARALTEAGVEVVSGDWEGKRRKDRRTLAILAPTNKAASVLRGRGVPATTIHRILYTPIYDPQYEAIAEWLAGQGERPRLETLGVKDLTEEALDRAKAFHDQVKSIPGALAAAGLRGSDFIRGWKRREDPLDVGFVDEASMLDERQFDDLREIFPTLILFGDPAQLAPVGASGEMVFEKLAAPQRVHLARIHRQADDNPILDLAHALADPDLRFEDFERMIETAAARDPRVIWAERVDADLMARSPVLVWRNATRVRLIAAFRTAHGATTEELLPGEPLICDGIELPLKHRKKRIDLEARGLIKGAQVIYLGPGRKPGFSRLHVLGAEDPRLSAASIVKIESPDEEDPFIPFAARMGAVFLHGAAVTIHKAQGSQWPSVQVFAPDIYAAARAGRSEAGLPLWKRLAYVAITRAEERLIWVVRNRLARPTRPLGITDLAAPAPALDLAAEDEAG